MGTRCGKLSWSGVYVSRSRTCSTASIPPSTSFPASTSCSRSCQPFCAMRGSDIVLLLFPACARAVRCPTLTLRVCHQVETIGDAYMAVTNLVSARPPYWPALAHGNHAVVVSFAFVSFSALSRSRPVCASAQTVTDSLTERGAAACCVSRSRSSRTMRFGSLAFRSTWWPQPNRLRSISTTRARASSTSASGSTRALSSPTSSAPATRGRCSMLDARCSVARCSVLGARFRRHPTACADDSGAVRGADGGCGGTDTACSGTR